MAYGNWHCKLCFEENNLYKKQLTIGTGITRAKENDDVQKLARLRAEMVETNQRLREISESHKNDDEFLLIN